MNVEVSAGDTSAAPVKICADIPPGYRSQKPQRTGALNLKPETTSSGGYPPEESDAPRVLRLHTQVESLRHDFSTGGKFLSVLHQSLAEHLTALLPRRLSHLIASPPPAL